MTLAPIATQRDFAADGPAVADLEAGNRLLGLGDDGFLPGDLFHVADGKLHDLLVAHSLADAHVQRDLLDPRHLHDGLVAELLHQLGNDLLFVMLL